MVKHPNCCCCSHPPVLIPMSKMVHWERTLPPDGQRYRPVGTIGAFTPPVRAMLQLNGMMSLWRVTGSKRPLQRRAPTNHAPPDDLLLPPQTFSTSDLPPLSSFSLLTESGLETWSGDKRLAQCTGKNERRTAGEKLSTGTTINTPKQHVDEILWWDPC